MWTRVVLIGCVAKKLDQPAKARDLYTSPLFAKRRAYAEATGLPWFILSAEHGLVTPDTRLFPYERQLTKQNLPEWQGKLQPQLRRRVSRNTMIEVHAGATYLRGLRSAVIVLNRQYDLDLMVSAPLELMPIGKQLQWYNRNPLLLAVAS